MRRWLINERHLSVLTAQARGAAIVTIIQRQATTASRNSRVTRCLKQDTTLLYKDIKSSLPDATSSLKRRTRECSFREKAFLASWSAQGRWSSATQTGGSAAWCVQSTRHVNNHHRCSAIPAAYFCLLLLTLWSAAAGWNNHMPMCIDSFSLHSKWIGLSKRDPNLSVIRRDLKSDRLIGNIYLLYG